MEGDLSGVRIIPSIVEFKDTEVNTVNRVNITVKNISKKSKAIRYYGPQTEYFYLKVKNPEQPIAPGLEVPAVVEYKAIDTEVHQDRLVVTVDGDVIEVPLHGLPCQPDLVLHGPVSFGNVLAKSKVISKEIPLYNHGSKAGEFKIKYSGNKPISIVPSSGIVQPHSKQIIKVEYVTKDPGKFSESAKVKLAGKETSSLKIHGNVVAGNLRLVSYETEEELSCIKFGSAYYGTDKTESAVLFNNGPEPVSFVTVLDEEAAGMEVGVDLSNKPSGDQQDCGNSGGTVNDLTSLVTAIPNQGMLAPYEKIPIFFRFSPRWNESKQGFKSTQKDPPRRDFALFLQLKILGSSEGFQEGESTLKSSSGTGGSWLEIGLIGTALPVQISLSPQKKYDFGECPVGEHVDTLCTLKNESPSLTAAFQFRRVAHYTANPASGKINPGHTQDVIFSFAPNQVGTFKLTQFLDVMGQVADNRNPFLLNHQVIRSIPVQFVGLANPVTVKKSPVFNPGITPKISNEVGMYVDTTVKQAQNKPRAALLKSQNTKLHRLKGNMTSQSCDNAKVAFPNDCAQSIRPSNRMETYKTIFTQVDRHTYVDPDYAFTDEEAKAVQAHKKYYIQFIDDLRKNRENKAQAEEFRETNNNTDLAMKPAAGLKPKKLLVDEVKPDAKVPTPPNANFKLLSTKQLTNLEKQTNTKMIDGLNAVPSTNREKSDCRKILSPQELHQVIIGPPTIEFGSVCLRSVSQRDLNIVNNLDTYIHIVVEVDCRELRQTSPLSQVVPPKSKTTLPLIFESNFKGTFQRSLDYSVNGFYRNHVTVFAEVVPVSLELSTDNLELEPSMGLPAEAGIRGIVYLQNKLNHAAEFTWSPILGDHGTAFSIRPATGMVDAQSELACEVVFHPSFLAPENGMFALQVHGGKTHTLKCSAKLGSTNVQFMDRRVMFGVVPLHLTTTRIATLKNNSSSHAYFQVLDPNPFPGLSVGPIHGVVPVGGVAELRVELTPNAVMKFDTRVQVAIRGWKTLELRMGGTVEPPSVEIDLPSFQFGGVFCGSSAATPFRLVNKVNTKTRIDFDLSRYADFTLDFPGKQTPEDVTLQLMNPGLYTVTIEGGQTIEGILLFKPTEVASYDFIMPVTINQTGAPTPAPTPCPPTPAASIKNGLPHIVNPRPVEVTVSTPRKKVLATALRQPLQLSHNSLEFTLSPVNLASSQASGTGQSKGTLLVNNRDSDLKWAVDLTQGNQVLEDGVFKFLHSSGMPFLSHGQGAVEGTLQPGQTQSLGVLFCPAKPGLYQVTVSIILDDDIAHPYQYLTLSGELKAPRMWFDPLAIVLTPVPLHMDVSAELCILAANYTKHSSISVELPDVECEDGSKLTPLSVTFPHGQEIKPCCGDEGQEEPVTLMCKVTFKSPRPVSFSEMVVFVDDAGNRFGLPVTATADNCLLTSYPFLAQHRGDHHIVVEQGVSLRGRTTASRESENVGEAVLVPCTSPPRPPSRHSTTATSSNFEVSSSSYEHSSDSVTDSTYHNSPREGALNKITMNSEDKNNSRSGIASRSLGSALFPDEDTEEGVFHTEVLLAVQRWFSSQGWPGGPHPISIPHSLRSGICKKPSEDKTHSSKGPSFESNNLKKEFKTVYDMVAHLCGRQVPGIPLNNPLPSDPLERAKQVYWQHSTLLTFLRTQGACVASVKPEYLMETSDYKNWVILQKRIETAKYNSGHMGVKLKTEEEEALEDQLFEAVSKRAWTDVLLQLLKTLLLAKITPRQFKNVANPNKNSSMPMVDPDPLCSNVYSIGERIVLLWLNHNYEQARESIWQDCSRGGVPPSRWIVNFDFDLLDGLVLAAVLGGHVPFLIQTHLHEMYTHPASAEQCLHNALLVVNALRHIGVDYDIQAIDITDPNPISMMMLCVHLYNHLPQYIPKSTVDFVGGLHAVVLRQVRLSNPSSKPLTYQAMIAGHDAQDFILPKGNTIALGPKSTHNLSIEFVSRFLRPAEATLVLVGRRQGSSVGITLVFNLRTQIDNIAPKTVVRCESACYELHRIPMSVTNPFPKGGEFRIVLVESTLDFPGMEGGQNTLAKKSKKKPKKVVSRTNHGKNKPEIEEADHKTENVLATKPTADEDNKNDNLLKAFFCPSSSVGLEAGGTAVVEVHFLPFQAGKRQCSVIFVNEEVGEFLYSIEAQAALPLPSLIPFSPTSKSVRISSAAAAGGGRGMFGGDDRIMYWKCQCGQELKESITVPVVNETRERALLLASQQYMSETELERRAVTGTLSSTVVKARTLDMLSINGSFKTNTNITGGQEDNEFTVEVDSEYYSVPNTLAIPNLQQANTSESSSVNLSVTFLAQRPGHYPCQVVLRCPGDIRVYNIECTVTPEGNETQIEFASPVHQPVTQNIPIVNGTHEDWPMEAEIDGAGFVGPFTIVAKAHQTTQYPLIFRPPTEGSVLGKLVLINTTDKVEHTFQLVGKGEHPLPLKQISLQCQAREKVTYTVEVPNITKRKLHYQVESDMGFISGPDFISLLPGKTGEYEFTLSPQRGGHFKGILAFVAGSNPVAEVDSDGDEIPDGEADSFKGYRIWYSLDVEVQPAKPEGALEITCACHKRVVLEVGLTNPTGQELKLEATIKAEESGLLGPASVTLPPSGRGVYSLTYAPAVIGSSKGSVIFYNEAVGEFWYALNLTAERPVITKLPYMECELGRWARQTISLHNPTEEVLQLIPTNSNTNNFMLERDNERPIELRPHSSLSVPVTFMPSTMGEGDHRATITFHCEQLGEWIFELQGCGLLPQPQDPVSITALVSSNSTLIIPFRNPLDIPVLVHVILTDKDELTQRVLTNTSSEESPFCLLLKHNSAVRLGPKSSLDIPLSFAPKVMSMFEAMLAVVVRKEDGTSWHYKQEDGKGNPLPRTQSGGIHEMRWLYPIHGFPELTSKDSQPAVVECQARERIEERIEVTLSGVAPSTGGPTRGITTRALTPADEQPKVPEGVVVGETLAVAEEFTYELIYKDSDTQDSLEPAIALSLVRKQRDDSTGLMILVFNVIYAPYQTMCYDVQLLVRATTGGVWRFPLRFMATEPDADDTIIVEATGLNQESSLGFRLTSQDRHPVPYHAYFMAGSDVEFTVSPSSGELLPSGTNGTLLKISFKPSKYGKLYQGKLIVQTQEMQWTYNVHGVLPDYNAPMGFSSQPMAGPHPDPRRRLLDRPNFIKDNLSLKTTAVSSPIKGAPLIIKQRTGIKLTPVK